MASRRPNPSRGTRAWSRARRAVRRRAEKAWATGRMDPEGNHPHHEFQAQKARRQGGVRRSGGGLSKEARPRRRPELSIRCLSELGKGAAPGHRDAA
jgi:hypothetical protein